VVLHQSFLGKRPESLDPVDVHLPVDESYSVVDPPVAKAIGDQAVVAPELIGIDEATPFHLPDRHLEEGLSLDIPDHLDTDLSSPFQDPEHRDLPGSTPAPLSFPPPAEIGLIHLDLTGEGEPLGICCSDGPPEQVEEPVDRVVGKVQLPGSLPYRGIQLEQLEGREEPREGYPRSLQDTALPRSPLLPAGVTPDLRPPDPSDTGARTPGTPVIRSEDALGPEVFFCSLLVSDVLLQIDEIHLFDHLRIGRWS